MQNMELPFNFFILGIKLLGQSASQIGGSILYLVKLHGNRCPDYEVGSLESHLNVNVAAVVPDPTFRIHNVQAHWSEEKAFLSPQHTEKLGVTFHKNTQLHFTFKK